MKNQTIASFMNIDEFIKNIAKELEEKYKTYPFTKIWWFEVKSNKEYYTVYGIMSVLENIFKNSWNK